MERQRGKGGNGSKGRKVGPRPRDPDSRKPSGNGYQSGARSAGRKGTSSTSAGRFATPGSAQRTTLMSKRWSEGVGRPDQSTCKVTSRATSRTASLSPMRATPASHTPTFRIATSTSSAGQTGAATSRELEGRHGERLQGRGRGVHDRTPRYPCGPAASAGGIVASSQGVGEVGEGGAGKREVGRAGGLRVRPWAPEEGVLTPIAGGPSSVPLRVPSLAWEVLGKVRFCVDGAAGIDSWRMEATRASRWEARLRRRSE